MKIALIQLNYHIGHFSYNRDKIIKAIQQAETAGVDLAVFSELCVCGYPPQDLLDYTDFIRKCEQTVTEIADCCRTTAAVIGTPMFNKENRGKKLVNAACFLSKGRINYIQPKTLLPTYDIFDEDRYFASNKKFNCFNFHGYKIGLTIC
ncbi:MAG TPA: nitrilase-related carbon-nitrogen hydrolase, partial [Spirochaetota bacterium]|nr:nitrilase-related carbon-nitrogen hydrolase [Spirochaetota bacterium]